MCFLHLHISSGRERPAMTVLPSVPLSRSNLNKPPFLCTTIQFCHFYLPLFLFASLPSCCCCVCQLCTAALYKGESYPSYKDALTKQSDSVNTEE
ncbi:hypothetical protein XENTR_v10014329 [Xenopus tropicalis]|nr:hypothetical protein XENTR_v10014329 [Xenopus tropicalis]